MYSFKTCYYCILAFYNNIHGYDEIGVITLNSYILDLPYSPYSVFGVLDFTNQRAELNIYFLCIYSHVHTFFWVISPTCPSHPPTPPLSPDFQAEPAPPLPLILLKRRHKHNKKDKASLLVELRTAIQRDS
jgi:hypothetical protein